MKISIFGIGYVGCISAAILADQGNQIIGVNKSKGKIDLINKGVSPIVEEKIGDLIAKTVKEGKLKATLDSDYAVKNSDVSVVCVGTPSNKDGSANLKYIKKVIHEIGESIKTKQRHFVVMRSTIPPGTMEEFVIPTLKSYNKNVGIAFNPEFMREGTAVKDYINPPYIIAAATDKETEKVMNDIYKDIDAEMIFTNFKNAELLKVVNNIFHALKIVFANEIKRFGEKYEIDPEEIMELVCKDKQLNISTVYLKPGFAYGGSCLPKDLRSFVMMAKNKNINIPVIENISKSNEIHIQDAISKIESYGKKKIGFVGLSFKQGTDDLRESPAVKIVDYFIKNGYELKIYDPDVYLSRLMGANKDFIEKEIPHIGKLLTKDLKDVFDNEIIVLNRKENIKKYLTDKHSVVDLI